MQGLVFPWVQLLILCVQFHLPGRSAFTWLVSVMHELFENCGSEHKSYLQSESLVFLQEAKPIKTTQNRIMCFMIYKRSAIAIGCQPRVLIRILVMKIGSMKKLLWIFGVLHVSLSAQIHSCCVDVSVNHQNNLLAMNESFAGQHYDPIPFTLESPAGEMISFKTPDGKEGKAYFIKSSTPTDRVVFVFHEWWGLNDYIKKEAERFYSELGNVDVYAIDLYDGKVATTVPEAQKLMGSMTEERSKAIISGAIAHIGKKAKIASIGWCMGGAWSLQSALLEGKQGTGCIMYYGMPESDLKKLKQLHCDIMGVFALKDGYITPEIVKTFEANLKSVGKRITVYNYDSYHAFANPSNPRHNKEYAADAHQKAIQYLKERLR